MNRINLTMTAVAPLSGKLNRLLKMYVVSAGAAGVGVLSLVQPSDAKIIYTPKHEKFSNHSFSIDLNNDGEPDFVFRYRTGTDHYLSMAGVIKGDAAVSAGQQSIRGVARELVGALPEGAAIGPADKFLRAPQVLAAEYYNSDGGQTYLYGKWPNAGTVYVGVQFQIAGQKHYGWIRMSVTIPFGSGNGQYPPIKVEMTGYAYESVANEHIFAGATTGSPDDEGQVPADPASLRDENPASLGALALGAQGLAIWRRE